MSNPVVAVALDAFSPVLLESWMARGLLPHLAEARAKGAYGWLMNSDLQPYENSWAAFLHGASPTTTGQWGHQGFDPLRYQASEEPAYDFSEYPPFYAINKQRRVAVFDLNLVRLMPDLNGIQVLGWGTEDNQSLRGSQPAALMADLVAKHGEHRLFQSWGAKALRDEGEAQVVSYRTPNVYDHAALRTIGDRLVAGVEQRMDIVRDLLARESWDLFATSFAEPHTAGHLLWHLGQQHPLASDSPGDSASDQPDPLLAVMQKTDAAVGEMMAALPDDAYVVFFSVFGMKPNVLDLTTTLFLPEFLFRWHWGEAALAAGEVGDAVGAGPKNDHAHWKDAIWALRTPLGESLLESPQEQEARNDPLDWNPLNWFRPLWPQMRAFALPSYSHGMIRLNVEGRDGSGCVAVSEYEAECERLTAALLELVDARTGRPIVREVTRTRVDPLDENPLNPPADLVVRWREDAPVDCVDSPQLGRIGPVPYFRTGGHATNGFLLAMGPGIPVGSELPRTASVSDLTATLLAMMGEPVPAYMEGAPLWPLPR